MHQMPGTRWGAKQTRPWPWELGVLGRALVNHRAVVPSGSNPGTKPQCPLFYNGDFVPGLTEMMRVQYLVPCLACGERPGNFT